MRWVVRIGAVLGLVWTVYCVSPYVALYRLARAVEARDPEAVRRRINGRALRVSLTRQAVETALAAIAKAQDGDPRQSRVTADAAAALVEPLVAALLTPDTIIDCLDDGWPQGLAPERARGPGGLRMASLAEAWALYAGSEGRGFRSVVVPFPPERPAEEQFRLRLRFGAGAWRLTEVEAPPALRERLVGEWARRAMPK